MQLVIMGGVIGLLFGLQALLRFYDCIQQVNNEQGEGGSGASSRGGQRTKAVRKAQGGGGDPHDT